jgi:hypothetical protein
MTFQPSSSAGATLRLIEINGVLFAVLTCRVQQKKHRPPHDKTSGLSFDKALYLMSTKTYTEIPDEQTNRTKREKINLTKKTCSQTSRLKNPEEC